MVVPYHSKGNRSGQRSRQERRLPPPCADRMLECPIARHVSCLRTQRGDTTDLDRPFIERPALSPPPYPKAHFPCSPQQRECDRFLAVSCPPLQPGKEGVSRGALLPCLPPGQIRVLSQRAYLIPLLSVALQPCDSLDTLCESIGEEVKLYGIQ